MATEFKAGPDSTALVAAMSKGNAEYQARRTLELRALKRTLRQEAPLLRNAPLIGGKDW